MLSASEDIIAVWCWAPAESPLMHWSLPVTDSKGELFRKDNHKEELPSRVAAAVRTPRPLNFFWEKGCMSTYLLIESRDFSENPDVDSLLDTAARLAEAGHTVDIFFIQNGVFWARKGANRRIATLAGQGVALWADDFSLAGRSLSPQDIHDNITVAGVTTLIRLLTRPECRPVWH